MNAAAIVAIIATAFLSSALTCAAVSPPARLLRRTQLELADARQHLDWWRRTAVNLADRNWTLRQQVASVNNTSRGW
jgi:hypothetical protein